VTPVRGFPASPFLEYSVLFRRVPAHGSPGNQETNLNGPLPDNRPLVDRVIDLIPGDYAESLTLTKMACKQSPPHMDVYA